MRPADNTEQEQFPPLPFDYVIDKERRLILTTAEGAVTVAEVRSKITRLQNDPDFDHRLNELIDATRVTNLYVPVSQALEFAGQPILSKTSRTAWIVTKSTMWKTLADLFAAYMSLHTQSKVFHDIASAMMWIGEEESGY